MGDPYLVVLICTAVLVAALAQRITGMGFALVAGPFLVLLLDPLPGVVFVNLCSLVSSLVVLARTHRFVDWKLAGMLGAASVFGTLPGSLIAVYLPAGVLETLIGALVVAALATSMLLSRVLPQKLSQSGALSSAFGLASGMMNAAAGIGGPALSAFAVLTRWNQYAFAATIQPVFIAMGICAVVSKVALDPSAWPSLSPGTWGAVLGALAVGMLGGEWGARRVPIKVASVAMLTLAFIGGLLTISRGVGLV